MPCPQVPPDTMSGHGSAISLAQPQAFLGVSVAQPGGSQVPKSDVLRVFNETVEKAKVDQTQG